MRNKVKPLKNSNNYRHTITFINQICNVIKMMTSSILQNPILTDINVLSYLIKPHINHYIISIII